ncbi:HAD family hydrolase [Laceyella putida]|uniref:HAD family hydrolase n=1 Tax=Laceyella putida TaxID=110101 RepID=A0ABW2RH72_9BACL
MMNTLPYPLLVSDIDGTLLDGHKRISSENKRSIARFRKQGGVFTLATGRTYMEAKHFIDELELDFPVILCNGTLLFEPATKRLLPVTTLPVTLIKRLLADAMERVACPMELIAYGIDTIYITQLSPATRAELTAEGNLELNVVTLDSFDTLPEVPYLKVVIIADPQEMPQVVAWSKTLHSFPLDSILSADNYFEILPRGSSKGAAIAKLLHQLQLEPRQLAAIGDHCNDLAMLQLAGLGAAVANAHPQVLQQADVIVPRHDEHAVSHLIEHFLLPTLSEQTIK